jgi:hypothetical protein
MSNGSKKLLDEPGMFSDRLRHRTFSVEVSAGYLFSRFDDAPKSVGCRWLFGVVTLFNRFSSKIGRGLDSRTSAGDVSDSSSRFGHLGVGLDKISASKSDFSVVGVVGSSDVGRCGVG